MEGVFKFFKELWESRKGVVIVVVVAGLLAFSFSKRQSIFKKLGIRQTPVILQSTKGIFQYVASEYYGEVILSSNTASERNFDRYLEDEIKPYVLELTRAAIDIRADNSEVGKRKERLEIFKSNYPELYNDERFSSVVNTVSSNELSGYTQISRRKNYEDDDYQFKDFLKISNIEKEERKKRKKEKELVYIARGKVLVGFDLSVLEKEDITINQTDKGYTIDLKDIKPEVLDTIMNPWYLPEKEIKGFEILYAEKRVLDFDMVTKLKHECKVELLNNALESGVILNAYEAAEESLKAFFSNIIDREVIEVKFDRTLLYSSILGDIAKDSILTVNELDMVLQLNAKSEMEGNTKDHFMDPFCTYVAPLEFTQPLKQEKKYEEKIELFKAISCNEVL